MSEEDEAAYPVTEGESITENLLFIELRKHADLFGVACGRGVHFAAPRNATIPDLDRSTIGMSLLCLH